MNPKVTIIVPCFNSEKWIEDCLRSVLNQTYKNIEVIFVDNESSDNSMEVAIKLSHEYPDLVISSTKNIYPNCWDEPRSEGFRLMTGDYVLVMGSDDHLDEKFIEKCMDIIKVAPDKIKALQSPICGIKSDTGIVTSTVEHQYKSVEDFKKQALLRCPVNTPTVIYNTDLYREGLLRTKPEIYGGAADYDLYCKLADNDIFIYPAPMWLGFYYRWHEDQATWKVQKEGINYDKMIQDYWRNKWQI